MTQSASQLEERDRARLRDRYHAANRCEPLIRAVIDGQQDGWIVAPASATRSAFVVTQFGFAAWVGEATDTDLDGPLQELLDGRAMFPGPRYWLWYDPPARWQDRLDHLDPALVRRRERTRLMYVAGGAPEPAGAREPRQGIRIVAIDREILDRPEAQTLCPVKRFWRSEEQFLAEGFGCAALHSDQVVAVCYAACVADGLAEVDVATSEHMRGTGLGTVVTDAFVRACQGRGVRPTWDCFSANAASMKLARSAGFATDTTYPLYSFNIPYSSR